ncbi:MAG: ABC transporter permease [Deltaproteobacteria bacterium]|nr:ABC transporter permease [Deltaproteobacteria bacterium]
MEILFKRLIRLIPVLLGISVIVFLMISLTPGDPVEIMLGDQQVTPEMEQAMRRDMGLDLPIHERFVRFLYNAAQGNFGRSFFHRRPVMEVIMERLPATIELTLCAMLMAIVVAIPLGVLAAVKKGTVYDRASVVMAMIGISMPGFWFGIILIILFAIHLQWLPVSGRSTFALRVPSITGMLLIDTLLAGRLDSFIDAVKHLILPTLTLGLAMAATLMQVTRASMMDVLQQDYILFAEAKGLKRHRVIFLHALKNALIPTITVAAIQTGQLLGGNMIIETIFGWPGVGSLVVKAIFTRNYPLVQAAVLIYVVIYVLMNFIADILYTVLNPRVRI